MKYAREKTLDPRNTQEKFFGPMKHARKNILDPQNTHEKIFWAQ